MYEATKLDVYSEKSTMSSCDVSISVHQMSPRQKPSILSQKAQRSLQRSPDVELRDNDRQSFYDLLICTRNNPPSS